jgi:prolyl 4-hydroxylase
MEIIKISGLLSPEECKNIIEVAEPKGFKPVPVYYYEPKFVKNIRNNEGVIFVDKVIAEKLWKRLEQVVPSIDGWEKDSLNPELRIYRYTPGQKFTIHVDGSIGWDSLKSFHTLLVYLNDDFEGGITNFYSYPTKNGKRVRTLEDSITPVTGDAVLFNHEWKHEGVEIQRGTKYVLRTSTMYKPLLNKND